MLNIQIILSIYGGLILLGGIMGYVKAGSKMSLIAGILSGFLILLGVFISRLNLSSGLWIVASTSLVLIVVFSLRFIKTQNFMPSGMLCIVSAAALIICLLNLFSGMKK